MAPRLSDFIDGLGPSIFAGLLTPQGILLVANRSALVAAGLQSGDVLGRQFEDTYWWDHSPDVRQQLREAIAQAAAGKASRYNVQIRASATSLIDVDFSLQPIRDASGAVAFLVPSASVTTERAQAEADLRESNEQFRQLADHITDAFWIRSPDMRELHYLSPAFERIWGRPAASLLANPGEWASFTAAEDREWVVRAFEGLTRDVPSLDIEYRIVRPDGEHRWIRARGFQIRDARGKLIRLTGIATDITEKKRLESHSLRAQRMESIGTLAGGIAHDLNNVLAPILMSATMLKDMVTTEDELGLLSAIQDSAERGAQLVQQVLSFARGVEGQRITIDPLHIMRDLLKVMRDTFPKSIEVRFAPASDLWSITGDPTQMHQVLLNLCVNARDAMPGGGALSISMTNIVVDETYAGMNPDAQTGKYVMVKIEDTGTGIPPGIRDRIFEPFFTTKGIGKGTGLGLSTSLGIVRSHGGFITMYTEADKGTTFAVYLPASNTPAGADQIAPRPTPTPLGNGELILLVDDEEAIRKIGTRMLLRYGYRVMLAAEGAEALALYARHRNDIALVLTDMAMPTMDGPALIGALLAMNPDVRIIGCSGLTTEASISPGTVGAGIRRFVSKPYTSEAMLTTIRDVLTGPAS